MAILRIDNRQARRLWLTAQGLASPPTGKLDVMRIIEQLGFVQLDSIQVVARAHHHILWSRNQNYREPMLNTVMADERLIFEHFTHDASVLPMQFLPYWQRQFTRKRAMLDRSNWYKGLPDAAAREAIKARIRQEGPLSTQAFDTKSSTPKEMWSRPPHKLALEYMWYVGELATSHRYNFIKHYDVAERIYPADLRNIKCPDQDAIDWLCWNALTRMSLGTPGEIQRFWDAVSAAEVKAWVARAQNQLMPIEVQAADGSWSHAIAPLDIEDRLVQAGPVTSRLRILNPFDPVIRDRNRLFRLFGFDYRVEMFVPAAKRKWGYYVFPILEGDRFVGRIEAKGDRKQGALNIMQFWPEAGVKWAPNRVQKLDAELERMRRFIGVHTLAWPGVDS